MVPYIAFDLDALARAENVGRSVGQPDTLIKGGLLNLWAHCFRETTDDVTPIQVRAFFGADVVDALVAFGFLEPTSDTYRVRGAGRYLRLKKAYSEGAAKTNALRRRPKASGSVRPSSPSGRKKTPVLDALTPSTEHRAPTTEEKQLQPEKHVGLAPPPITQPPPDKFASAEAFWSWAQFKRGQVGFVTEKFPNSAALGAWWSEVHLALGGDPKPLEEAFHRFAVDKHWESVDPPLPFRAFISQWRNFARSPKRLA